MRTSSSTGPTLPEKPLASSFQLPSFRGSDYLVASVMGLLTAALYLRTLAPGLLGGDSGEFQFAAWLGGFAHPTGYPLYLVLGYLWTHLIPLYDPAWRMNAFSALWAGVAVGLLYLLALRVLQFQARRGSATPDRRSQTGCEHTKRDLLRAAALLTAVTFAVTPTFWSQAVVAEVYTLNLALIAGILLSLVTWAAQPPDRRSLRPLYAAALLFGLSLAHHRTTVLWLPAIVAFLWIERRSLRVHQGAASRTKRASRAEATSSVAVVEGREGVVVRHDTLQSDGDFHRPHPATAQHTPLLRSGCFGLMVTAPSAAWASPRHRVTRSPRHLVTITLLIVAPLLLYLYIPLVAAHAPYRQMSVGSETLTLYRPTVAGFIKHVTGSEFGAEFRSPAGAVTQVIPGLGLLRRELTPAGIALGLIGLAWLAWRSRAPRVIPAQAGIQEVSRSGPARAILALTGIGFLTLLTFNLFYGIGDIAAYYTPLYTLWCLWMALGAAAIGEALAARAFWRIDRRPPVTQSPGHHVTLSPRHLVTLSPVLLAFLLPAYLLLTGFPAADQSRNNQARTSWDAILAEPIPSGAILMTNDRDEMMPFWYLRYVEGVRPDLTGLFPLIQPGPDWTDVVAATASALRSGRPVLLIKPMPGLEIRFNMQAEDRLVRVLGPAVSGPPARPADASFGDPGAGGQVRLLGYDIQPAMLAPGQPVTITLHWQPAAALSRDYTTFVHLVNADGRVIGASDHRPGGVYYPSSQWKVGEILADTHAFTAAVDLGRPPYALEVGLYTGEGALQHLSQPQRVGIVGRQRPPDPIPTGVARLDASFGGQIALAGSWSAVQGDRLALTLYWQALMAPAADYTVFVHLLDQNGKIVAQYDGQPLGGELPTRAWPPGYTIADPVALPMPSALPPGAYRLVAGLYDAATGARLAAVDPRGETFDNAISLGEITWLEK